jgi:hypothetical protein
VIICDNRSGCKAEAATALDIGRCIVRYSMWLQEWMSSVHDSPLNAENQLESTTSLPYQMRGVKSLKALFCEGVEWQDKII